jgi:hypothetical protein
MLSQAFCAAEWPGQSPDWVKSLPCLKLETKVALRLIVLYHKYHSKTWGTYQTHNQSLVVLAQCCGSGSPESPEPSEILAFKSSKCFPPQLHVHCSQPCHQLLLQVVRKNAIVLLLEYK